MTEERTNAVVEDIEPAAIAAAAAVAGSALFVLFVLPAEFHRDPTGFGKLTGLDRLAGPEVVTVAAAPAGANQTARYYQTRSAPTRSRSPSRPTRTTSSNTRSGCTPATR
jgi:hypothetical protein